LETFTVKCLEITGGHRLEGRVTVSGNKNAALPMIAAAMLTGDEVILHNVPDILDVRNMLALAMHLGAEVTFADGTAVIRAAALRGGRLPKELCSRLRTSLLFAGPLAARFGQAEVFPPGGDVIGRRRLDGHIYGLARLGIAMLPQQGSYLFAADRRPHGAEVFFDEASVTATEHVLTTAALAKGRTTIRNAACEPHVTQVAELLNRMGARISGLDTNLLVVDGVDRLHGAEMTVSGDHVEAGSYLALVAATGGSIEVDGNLVPHDYLMIQRVFERLGINVAAKKHCLAVTVRRAPRVKPDFGGVMPTIADGPWPQFPSDMLSCMVAVATQVRGSVLFFEKMFESRLYFVDKLMAMGANAVVCDPHRVVINGPTRLHGSDIPSPDIRAGMALVIAACCAEGHSRIKNAEVIFRGYCGLQEKLRSLGADLTAAEE
jgi:UDP-N-acetylglucosamine 1-carboxyvinyltransferase